MEKVIAEKYKGKRGKDVENSIKEVFPLLIKGKKVGTNPSGDYYYYACKEFDNKTGKCKIYDKRPEMCKRYPGDTRPMHKGCVYTEEIIDEN